MADQIVHAIWRSEIHRTHVNINRDGSHSVGYGPAVNFGTGVDLDYVRSRVRRHRDNFVAALALERFLIREVEEKDEWVDKVAECLYVESRMDRGAWFEVEEDDPQLAESFRRMARWSRALYFEERNNGAA